MVIFTKPGIMIKIQLLQGSQARNYLESKERLFLETIFTKLQNETSNDLNITNEEEEMLESIFTKYNKYM